MKEHILWDLDGTLTDPKIGITSCIEYALRKAELFVPQDLRWCIGPPLHVSFASLAPQFSETQIWELVAFYRERFSTIGLFENDLYPQIQDVLKKLSSKKKYLATSKPHVFAKRIISHFNLDEYFVHIYGSELDGVRSDKTELISYILSEQKIDASNAIMIGDRKYDILGAQAVGLKSIGVTWGYGGRDELTEAGADYIIDQPIELLEILK